MIPWPLVTLRPVTSFPQEEKLICYQQVQSNLSLGERFSSSLEGLLMV